MKRATVLALLALVLAAPAGAELVEGEATAVPRPTMSVTGIGRVQVAPDTVRITASVVTEGPTVAQARERNARVVQKALGTVEALGLPKVATRTLNYTMERVIREASVRLKADPEKWELPWTEAVSQVGASTFELNVPVTLGYRASNTLTVRVQGLPPEELSSAAGKIVDALMAAGCNQIIGVAYSLEGGAQEQYSRQALVKAVQDAQATAEAVAAATGRRLVGIRSVSPSYMPVSEMRQVQSALPRGYEGPSTTLNAGMLELTAQVTIQYEFDYNPGDTQFLTAPRSP
jgi:uncharacterized protein YggE